jgi:hypothetical protein
MRQTFSTEHSLRSRHGDLTARQLEQKFEAKPQPERWRRPAPTQKGEHYMHDDVKHELIEALREGLYEQILYQLRGDREVDYC